MCFSEESVIYTKSLHLLQCTCMLLRSDQFVKFCDITDQSHSLGMFPESLTCDPLHPGGVINAQVVVEDLEDVSQDDAEVFRGHHGAALIIWR